MKSITITHRVAVSFILASLLVFFVGISLRIAFDSNFPVHSDDIVMASVFLLAISVPFSFVCLILCAANGVVSSGNVIISLIASLFFFVFGYMAAVFTLGSTIKAKKREDENSQ